MRKMAAGSPRQQLPAPTALAPTSMNSSTSRAEETPPMPMMGILTTLAISRTHKSATGLTAGPESLPDGEPS